MNVSYYYPPTTFPVVWQCAKPIIKRVKVLQANKYFELKENSILGVMVKDLLPSQKAGEGSTLCAGLHCTLQSHLP